MGRLTEFIDMIVNGQGPQENYNYLTKCENLTIDVITARAVSNSRKPKPEIITETPDIKGQLMLF